MFRAWKQIIEKNCIKLAVECDCNSKISQFVENLWFCVKINGTFRKKTLNFFKSLILAFILLNAAQMGLFTANVFPLLLRFFGGKSESFSGCKTRKIDEKTVFFLKKNASQFLKRFFTKNGGSFFTENYCFLRPKSDRSKMWTFHDNLKIWVFKLLLVLRNYQLDFFHLWFKQKHYIWKRLFNTKIDDVDFCFDILIVQNAKNWY